MNDKAWIADMSNNWKKMHGYPKQHHNRYKHEKNFFNRVSPKKRNRSRGVDING